MALAIQHVKFCKRACHLSRSKTFFVSYPKSGRTWVRFLVDDYKTRLYGLKVKNVFKAERRLRLRHHVEWTHLAGFQRNPYHAMTPDNLDLLRRTPCVFMTRNFHATLASAWFQVTQRLGVPLADKDAFLHGTCHGIMHLIAFHNMWLDLERELPQVTYVSYARLRNDTRAEFIRILEALRLPVDPAKVDATLEAGTFERMKQLAASEVYQGTPLAPTDHANPDSAKVRSGSSGGYRTVFSDEQNRFISDMIARFFTGRDDPRFAECVNPETR
ncbi:MAG TPA: sulfotransferase domain-containing protein [Luteolibacter sp.]|nr:sulfotransferase domain-containing protein [Luteolibacter sp.]